MSSRALRKLQGGAGLGEEEMEQPVRGGQAFNAFSLVSRSKHWFCYDDVVRSTGPAG